MNRRGFFKLLGGVAAACLVPLPEAARERGMRYIGTVTGRWTSSETIANKTACALNERRAHNGYFRHVFKEMQIDVARARKLKAADIRDARDEVLAARADLQRRLADLQTARTAPLRTTTMEIVKVGPDDPAYGDPFNAPIFAGDWEWVNKESPWKGLVEQSTFPENMGAAIRNARGQQS